MRFILLSAVILLAPALGYSDTTYVPDDYAYIQWAIDAAVNGDTIVVRPGTYAEHLDFIGKAITVTSEGGPEVTVIDGSNVGTVVTFVNSEELDSILEGFTVTGGSGTGNGPAGDVYGGGIYCNAAAPTLRGNIISGNTAFEGGGICCFDPPEPVISDNRIVYNTAEFGAGIALWNSSPEIKDNIISWNTANTEGGGLLCSLYCDPIVDHNIIEGNSAVNYGGGLEFWNNCSPDITDNLIMNNTVSNYRGGGIVMAVDSKGTIRNNTITGNAAGTLGGGVYLESNSTPTLTNNTIVHNSAEVGGGGLQISECSPLLEHNIISNNDAVMFGGGISTTLESTILINNIISGNTAERGGAYDGGRCSPTMKNNTFYANIATDQGGAIWCNNNSSMVIIDTIFWENDAPTGPTAWLGKSDKPSSMTFSYSDVEGGQASVHVEPGCTLNWGAGMIDADPCFAAGTKGFVYLSQVASGQPVNSPCVDTGSDLASNLGLDSWWTRTDETPDSGVVDMGYHYGPFLYPALQIDAFTLPEATGGTVNYLLLAGPENGLRNYLLVGGVSGTKPGMLLPGGYTTLPIQWDWFSDFVMTFLNTPVFFNFMGKLDAQGTAVAQLNLPPVPGAAGVTMHYAYCCNNPFDFVSNPVAIKIVP